MYRCFIIILFVFISVSVNAYSTTCGKFVDDYNGKYCKDIESLSEKGMVDGYHDRTFRYNNTLSRRELVKLIVLAKQKELAIKDYKKNILMNTGELSCFSDVSITEEMSDYICYAKEKLKLIGGYNDGSFRPNALISYGEASKMILLSISNSRQCWKSYTDDSLVNYVSYMNNLLDEKIDSSAEVKRDFFAHMLNIAIEKKDTIISCTEKPILPTPENPSVVVMDLDNEPLRQIFWKNIKDAHIYRIWRTDPVSPNSPKMIYCSGIDDKYNKYSYIDNNNELSANIRYEYRIQAGITDSQERCNDNYVDIKHWSQVSEPTILHSKTEKLILVDGIHPLRTGGCIHNNQDCLATDWDDYLGNGYDRTRIYLVDQLFHNNKGMLNLRDLKNYDIYAFRWSGDVISGSPNIPFLDLDVENEDKGSENLKVKFNNWMNNYVVNVSQKSQPTVSFLAYSWGTVITTDFIASLTNEKMFYIGILVTIGCPVTGANINFLKDPFWKVAGDKLKDNYQARWVNIVKNDDVVAWEVKHKEWEDFSPVDNFVSVGANSDSSFCQKSNKGRLPELFPVSGSAMEMKYLNTSLVKAGFYGGVDFGQLMFLQLLVNTGNLDDYVEKTGSNLSVASIKDIGESIFNHHLICPHGGSECGYSPDQILKFILNNKYCSQ